MEFGSEYRWTVREVKTETPLVTSLYLAPISERPQFTAGQYLTVRFEDCGPAEGKAYSISSAPHEPLVRLSVKKIGAFSETLGALRAGDLLTTSAPYGFFYPEEEENTPLMFVAGGIGVAPCLSIIKDLAHKKDARQIELHYSNQTNAEIAFLEELLEVEGQCTSILLHLYVTREESRDARANSGRMSPESVLRNAHMREEADFFLCGSMDFTKSVWKMLRDAGIAEHRLYTEGFF